MEHAGNPTIFDYLIWGGAFLSLVGLVGLICCIVIVAKVRRAKLSEDALREKLKRAIPLNLVSLFTSVLGLMLVVIGIFLR